MEDFRSFYFDLALSSAPPVLDLALKVIPRDHILYGVSCFDLILLSPPSHAVQSDFPYAPVTAYPAFLEDLEEYEMSQKLRSKINFGNAVKLIPRLGQQHSVQRL